MILNRKLPSSHLSLYHGRKLASARCETWPRKFHRNGFPLEEESRFPLDFSFLSRSIYLSILLATRFDANRSSSRRRVLSNESLLAEEWKWNAMLEAVFRIYLIDQLIFNALLSCFRRFPKTEGRKAHPWLPRHTWHGSLAIIVIMIGEGDKRKRRENRR